MNMDGHAHDAIHTIHTVRLPRQTVHRHGELLRNGVGQFAVSDDGVLRSGRGPWGRPEQRGARRQRQTPRDDPI
jgi:hypothetical protein